MKKLLLLMTLFAFACSTSEDRSPNIVDESNTIYRLVKVIERTPEGLIDETTDYEYNSRGLLFRIINISNNISYISTVNYNSNDKVVSISRSFGSDFTYIYEGNLISSTSHLEDGILFRNEYTYNEENQMTIKKQFDDGVFCCENTFSYSNSGNVIGYDYDIKNNPFKISFPIELFKIDDFPNNNNITLMSSTIFEYEYNNENYPTMKTAIVDNDIIYTMDFEYQEVEVSN